MHIGLQAIPYALSMQVLLHDRHKRCCKKPSQGYNDTHKVITYPIYRHLPSPDAAPTLTLLLLWQSSITRAIETLITLITGIPVTLPGRTFVGFLYVY